MLVSTATRPCHASEKSTLNASANPVIVRRVGVGLTLTTGFTAAQELRFQLQVARSWTVADSGGTAVALTGNNCKHRTSLATPTSSA